MARKVTIEFLGQDKSLGKTMGEIDGKSSKLMGVLGKVGVAAAAGFAVAGAAAVKFTADAAQLDAKQREVVTLFGETGAKAEKSLGRVREITRKVSDEFGIAQETLTGGLYQAISAGVPKKNALEFMRVASKAATAGVTDVETAVDGITTTVNAFGLEAKDASKISDSMFTAVKGGKTTFEELSSSLFNVGPAAAAAGVEFTEVNAAIATLTASGTPTSVATTQLRSALDGLQKPSEELTGIFQKLGFENAQTAIESKGLGFALDAVKKASNGNNGELQKLLGSSEAVAAANVLAGTGAKKFTDEMKAQGEAAGATDAAFKVIAAGAAHQFDLLKTNLSNVGMTIGQALLPHLNTLLTWINGVGMPAFKSFGNTLQATVAPALARIGEWVQVKVLPALRMMGEWITANVLPVFRRLGTEGPSFFGKLQKAAEGIAQTVAKVVQIVATRLEPVFSTLVGTFRSKLLPTMQLVLDRFLEWQPTIQRVVTKVVQLASAILGRVLPPIIRFAGVWFSNVIPALLDTIEVMAKIIGKLYEVGAAFVNGVKDVAKWVAGVKDKVASALQFVGGIPDKAKAALAGIGGALVAAGQQLIQGLIDGISSKIASLRDKLQSVTKLIPDWKGPLDKDKILLTPAGVALMEGLIKGIDKGKKKLKSVLERVTEYIKGKQDKLADLLSKRKSIIDTFGGFGKSVFGTDTGTEDSPASVEKIIEFSASQRAKADQLNASVGALIAKGLSRDLIQQMIDAGAAGEDQINLLATATDDQIRQLNANNAATTSALAAAGLKAADAMLKDQIDGARRDVALADGIRDKLAELLEKQEKNTVIQIKIGGRTIHATLRQLKRDLGRKLELD